MAVAERELSPPAIGQGPQPMRWTREQYYQMAELGWFDGKRVELIEGEIIEMSPIGSRHWATVNAVGEKLRELFGAGFVISIQETLDFGPLAEPQPDIAVVAGNAWDYQTALPTTAALVVEVADSSLDYERTRKAGLYARAGIQDYWIINLRESRIEVYRRPAPASDRPLGFGYLETIAYQPGETITPRALAEAHVSVSDLLPCALGAGEE